MHSLAISLFGRIGSLACAFLMAGIAAGSAGPAAASVPADTLYGSALVELGDPGEHSIVIIDQNHGSMTWLETQAVNFQGLAFDSDGRLFATDCVPLSSGLGCSQSEPSSVLMELDPMTGAILDTIGTVTDVSGFHPEISTLSVQPGTDILYGFGGYATSRGVEMWTIDKSTAMATLVASLGPCVTFGTTPNRRGCGRGYAFAPDGSLYHLASNFTGVEAWLIALDPSTGALITSIPIDHPTGEGATLAVRSDGTLFSSYFSLALLPKPCRGCPPPDPIVLYRPLLTIDPLTGAATEVGGGGPIADLDFSPAGVELVEIDIKPGSDPNAVNPTARGILPVAILGSDAFDVADVDPSTLAFGPGEAGPLHSSGGHAEDVNDDGYTDWVSHYRLEEVEVTAGDTELCLTGETLDGIPFEGCDAIVTVPNVGERWRVRANRQR